MTDQSKDLQQDKQEKPGEPADAGLKKTDRAEHMKPVRVGREEVEKNIPADPDPDDPVSP